MDTAALELENFGDEVEVSVQVSVVDPLAGIMIEVLDTEPVGELGTEDA